MAIGEDQPNNKNQKFGKNKTLARTGCVILDGVRIKNVWIHHVDRNIGNCLNKRKAVQENESANKQGLASECRYS